MGRLRLSLQQVPASFGSMLKLGLSLFLAFIFVILTEASGPDINEVRKLDAQLPDHTSRVKREAAKGCKGKKCRREKQRRKIAKQEKGRDKSGKKKAAKRKTGKGGRNKAGKRKGGKNKAGKRKVGNRKSGRRKVGKKKDKKRKTGKGKTGKRNGKRKGKGKRKLNKGKGKESRKETRQQFDNCFPKIFAYTKMLKKSRNIQQQFTRINGTKDKIAGKAGKKDDFNGTLTTLVSSLGGNKTNPRCSNTSRAYQDTLSTLDGCSKEVEDACKFPFDDAKLAELKVCYDVASELRQKTEECLKPSLTDAEGCTCFNDLSLDSQVSAVKNCSIDSENSEALKAKNACKKKFSACKKAEDDSISLVDTCKEKIKCGGASSKEEGEKQLKALTPLSNALKQTGFADALKKLGLDTGTGSDGKLPSTSGKIRVIRQSESKECTKVLDNWKSFNASGDQGVPSVEGDVNETAIDDTVKTLDTLNNSPTLESDLDSCQKETRQGVVIAIIQISFYVFWCGWFQVTIVEIKITIIVVTFGLPAPSPAPTPAVTTAGPGRNLKKLVAKHLLLTK